MKRNWNQDDAGIADGNDDPPLDYEKRATHYLKAIGKAPYPSASKDARELHRRLKAAVEDLHDRQRDSRTMSSANDAVSYVNIAATLINLVCEMLVHIKRSQVQGKAETGTHY